MLGDWRQARSWQRFGYLVGGALVLVGLAHLAAWLLAFTALDERRRLGLVRVATVGYVALVVVSVLQAATGVAPFDVGLVAAVLYLLGVGLLGAAFLAALLALRNPDPAAA
ncbi:MAG TPA: hypothetical protein VFU54_02215 [Actinomycetota bacterium]|nr:hypothetical protein [Actinomycetota bacterium]